MHDAAKEMYSHGATNFNTSICQSWEQMKRPCGGPPRPRLYFSQSKRLRRFDGPDASTAAIGRREPVAAGFWEIDPTAGDVGC